MNKKYLLAMVGALLFQAPNSVIAQTALPDAGLLMRESIKGPELPRDQEVNEIEAPAAKKPMAAQSSLRVKVAGFTFSGNTQIPSDALQAQIQSYAGRELTFDDLQQAVAVITDYYRAQGFLVAYAYLPEQTLINGQVEIVIVEGHLDGEHLKGNSINYLNDTRIKPIVLQRFLDAVPEGELISENRMNKLSLLINQLPGINAKVVLAPGKDTGTSSLTLKIKEAPLISGYASTDNHGLYSTGYYRFNGGISLNDPLGLGDQLNLRAQTTETGDTVSGWADYSAPINGYGTRLAVNFSELGYTLGRDFTSLKGNGLARTVGASLSHPLWLTRTEQLTASVRYDHRWLEDNLDAVSISRAREIDVANMSLFGRITDNWLFQPAITQAFINVAVGEVAFTNDRAYAVDKATGIDINGGYHKFNGMVNRTQTLWGPFSAYANLYGQVASKNLDSSERLSLGGPNAIRAYPVGEGNADEGWYANFEGRYRIPTFGYIPGYLELIGFIDTGYAHFNVKAVSSQVNNSQHLTGYGLGLNWLEAGGFSVRTSIAWRDTNKQPTADPTASGPNAYFQLTKLF